MNKYLIVLFILIVQSAIAQFSSGRDQNFDFDWKFQNGKIQNATSKDFDDSNWRNVNLPHDWSIEDLPNQNGDDVIGPFSKNAVSKNATGFTVGGTAWYRKSFVLDKSTKDKKVFVRFDGVYRDSDVWINGHHLGNHPNGYTPFEYDLTPYLLEQGKKNVLAVEVKNEGHNSRWYSGSGIYRHVWLSVLDQNHILNNGLKVLTDNISTEKAHVEIRTNLDFFSKGLKLQTLIYNKEGRQILKQEEAIEQNSISQKLIIEKPHLWNINDPYLYEAKVSIIKGADILDSYVTHFGVRQIEFSASDGFKLNGKPVKLKGGCIHHDNGILGAAAYDKAEIRKVKLLKEYGYNAVRPSHNPFSPRFLQACDELGLLVVDEAFDMWNEAKTPGDYSNDFKDWWQKDLGGIIDRDFNHPSVILWSIGNEIPEVVDSLGYITASKLAEFVKMKDSSRPVTAAVPFHIPLIKGKKWDTTAPFFESLDVGGYNYSYSYYNSDHRKFPDRVMLTTEYFPPKAYENWKAVEENDFVIGMFSWTAMDYLGEAGLGLARIKPADDKAKGFVETFMDPDWPVFNAYTGEIDLIGNKKPSSYYLDVVWGKSPVELLIHKPITNGMKEINGFYDFPDLLKSWTWPKSIGDTLEALVYTQSDRVKLFLNDIEIAEKEIKKNEIKTSFSVPYSIGKMEAIAYKNDVEIGRNSLNTVGKPNAIRLKPETTKLKANGQDLAFIQVELVDSEGNIVPDSQLVKFQLTGQGSIAGIGNANPSEMRSFQNNELKLFQGKGMIVVKTSMHKGSLKVYASADQLKSDSCELRVE
ncbi:sugar-binding domain-containing protein [Jiulongibacter sediminis]|uniref:sugar-binding domain-containing protein n=1 Tax=Jiulongibacter sediminis TaxID=1605367 RepID=UPI0026EF5F45|nr:sugar-binding domain-containing protein [Jiulongibacter sediminis]